MDRGETASLVITCQRPFPPAGGAALRNWQNINGLTSRGPVDVLSVGVEEGASSLPGVREWKTFSWRQLLDGQSVSELLKRRLWPIRPGVHPAVDLFRQGLVRDWLRSRLSEFSYDVAVIEELFLAGYAPVLQSAGCRVVYDAHNVESALHADLTSDQKEGKVNGKERLLARLRQDRIKKEEESIVRKADYVWTCSESDQEGVATLYGRSDGVSVVPNGVNFKAYGAADSVESGADWSRYPLTVVFAGAYAYHPNAKAAKLLINEVYPRLRERVPESRLVLVGRNPSKEMIAASLAEDGIEVTGEVPDVLPYLSQPCVVAVPLELGGGTRLKILEAFAVGRPVVSSQKGAEGIEASDGQHLMLREEPEELVDAIVQLWNDSGLRGRMVASALDLVRETYSWESAAKRIKASLNGGEGSVGKAAASR